MLIEHEKAVIKTLEDSKIKIGIIDESEFCSIWMKGYNYEFIFIKINS